MFVGTFTSGSPSAALYEHNIYTVEDDKLFARSVQVCVCVCVCVQ